MRAVFAGSRYLVLIAVLALLVSAAAVFIYGGITSAITIVEAFTEFGFNAEGSRMLSVEVIELIDLFLLGTVLYITSVGLYELFVDPSIEQDLPAWLSVKSLEQLKFNLVAVLVVMLIVLFLGEVASQNTGVEGWGLEVLALGAGIALVIAAAGATVVMLGDVHFRGEALHETEEATHQAPEEASHR